MENLGIDLEECRGWASGAWAGRGRCAPDDVVGFKPSDRRIPAIELAPESSKGLVDLVGSECSVAVLPDPLEDCLRVLGDHPTVPGEFRPDSAEAYLKVGGQSQRPLDVTGAHIGRPVLIARGVIGPPEPGQDQGQPERK